VIVLIEAGGESFGVVVESVTRIGRVPRSRIVPVPNLGSDTRLVRGVVQLDDGQLLQLEPASLSTSGPKTVSSHAVAFAEAGVTGRAQRSGAFAAARPAFR
jgi:chemotaxis signal transduction protein